MEISVSTGLCYTKGYKEILDMIAATSFRNIELFLNQAFVEVPVEELKMEIDKRGLKVLSIHTPLEFIAFPKRESEEFWIEKSIELSRIFGSKVIVSHIVMGKYFMDIQGGLDNIHRENVLKYRNVEGVFITTENLPCVMDNSFLTSKEKFINFVVKNRVPITFDTTHCEHRGDSIIDMFKKVKHLVKNIHLSDFKDGNEHKVLGTGDLPLDEFLKLLKDEEYDGIVTVELDFENKNRNDISTFEEAVNGIEKSYQYIERILGETH